LLPLFYFLRCLVSHQKNTMKKSLVFAVILVGASVLAAQAQGPNRQPLPVEERVERTVERLKPALELNAQQEKEIAPVYTDFYTATEKLREGNRRPEPGARQKLVEERDQRLKAILSEAQMIKLKALEEQMRQRRPGLSGKHQRGGKARHQCRI
jgi:Skp family chaperone for outer membrane proteins